MTQVSEVMTRGVRTLSPKDNVVLAAQAMDELDVGAIPVCEGDRLVGMITDRDIVLRAVAQNMANDDTTLETIMSDDPKWCFDDQSTDEALATMQELQLRRLPVIDRERNLGGIVSLGDLAVKGDDVDAGQALGVISEPAQPDRSHQSAASGPAGGGSASGIPRD
jgi:CBS domain-containing protein